MDFARPWRMLGIALALYACAHSRAEERLETFDRDPGWDGHNNRPAENSTRTVIQDFGYSSAPQAGIGPGVIGGTITPDGAPAYFAKAISSRTLNEAFSASGTLQIEEGGGNTLLGFFNSQTLNEWRTPNSIVFRFNGRGDIFHAHIEYATSKWRAGAGVFGRYDREADRNYPLEIASKGIHRWSISYDPAGNDGGGTINATFDDQRAGCNLQSGHKQDGASFDRFGLLNAVKSVDSPGKLWLSEVTIDGKPEKLDADPQWIGFQNRRTYQSEDVRPRFNFGHSATHFSGGAKAGEMGGLFFRGDCRYPEKMAYYGARLETLTLERPLRASGMMTLRRGVSDSSTLLGFFNATRSTEVNPSQRSALPRDFLGLCIEGPSSEGFFVYPCYRVHGDMEDHDCPRSAPRIYPDNATLRWKLDYDPAGASGAGSVSLRLGDQSVTKTLEPSHRAAGAEFDRFGLITPWIDGNGQVVYFDDIEYTYRQLGR
ncbi:MAG: hypothetical protein HZB26_16185 [Candidatus Hydrogenedentes bacterium]|nr:hypothetical protein [Candidatus Hydrogenedentota bacterium]